MEDEFFSNCDAVTLSHLYKADLPQEGAVYVPKKSFNCATDEDGEEIAEFYKNDSSLDFFEFYRPNVTCDSNILFPFKFFPFVGPLLEIANDYIPSNNLQDHWVRVLGNEAYRPKFCGFKEDKLHFVQRPMSSVNSSNHVVDPHQMRHFFSKEFIQQINCPQAPVYTKDNVQFPCVVKSAFGSAAKAVFKCLNEKDFNDAMDHHEMFQIPYVINKMIDIKEEYCVQFCVNKRGNCTMVGATKPRFDEKGYWAGSSVDLAKQQVLRDHFRNTVEPVAEKLQSFGFFGYVGCDVLVDKEGKHYVVDINPRLNNSSPLLLGGLQLQKKGWTFGIFVQDPIIFLGSEEQLIEKCEKNKTRGEIVVFAYSRVTTTVHLRCVFLIYSTSIQECWDILADIKKDCRIHRFKGANPES